MAAPSRILEVSAFTPEAVTQGGRAPARVLPPQLGDALLNVSRDLVGATCRTAGGVGEGAKAAGLVAAQPAVHRLARDPVPEGDLDDRETVQDLEHGLVTLFHDSQLDEHDSCPPRSPTFLGRLFERRLAPASWARV